MTAVADTGRRVVRLALGLEVTDAVRGDPAGVEVAWEQVPRPWALPPPGGPRGGPAIYDPGIGLPRLSRGARPGRFHLVFSARNTPAPPARVRIVDPARRYVPRRLEIPFADLAAVLAEENTPARPGPRGRTIGIFPGAAFPFEGGSTGVRGRVVDATGQPVRWVRVQARHLTRATVLGIAHGDDRGEFLLLLRTSPTALDAPAGLDFDVRVAVLACPVDAPPPEPLTGRPSDDPLGDLVPEPLAGLGLPDPAAGGEVAPASYTRAAEATLTLTIGRITSPNNPIQLP